MQAQDLMELWVPMVPMAQMDNKDLQEVVMGITPVVLVLNLPRVVTADKADKVARVSLEAHPTTAHLTTILAQQAQEEMAAVAVPAEKVEVLTVVHVRLRLRVLQEVVVLPQD
jgi:hypothetical protein